MDYWGYFVSTRYYFIKAAFLVTLLDYVSCGILLGGNWRTAPSYRYVNCYRDANSRILPVGGGGYGIAGVPKLLHDDLTNEKCVDLCAKKGYMYAGTSYGNQCWCGDDDVDYERYGASSECTYPCAGDLTEICGGPYATSVYIKYCPLGHFGHHCKKKCHCRGRCNPISGKCIDKSDKRSTYGWTDPPETSTTSYHFENTTYKPKTKGPEEIRALSDLKRELTVWKVVSVIVILLCVGLFLTTLLLASRGVTDTNKSCNDAKHHYYRSTSIEDKENTYT